MKEPVFYRVFDYDKTLLPNPHLAALEAGVGDIEQAKIRTGFTIGYPGWGVLYYATLCSLDPDATNVLVETGTNLGCSTIVLAQALIDSGTDGVVLTVEIDEDYRTRALENLRAAGVADRVVSAQGDAKQVLPEMLQEHGEIRVAFLDGSHLCGDVVAEFALVHPRLAPRGVVLFDNTYQIAEEHEDQRVFGALRHIERLYGGHLVNLPFVSWYTPGFAIWQQEPFGG